MKTVWLRVEKANLANFRKFKGDYSLEHTQSYVYKLTEKLAE